MTASAQNERQAAVLRFLTLDAIGAASELRYAMAEIRANLVTKGEIATRTGVGHSAVHGWVTRYEDWPEPMVQGAPQGGRNYRDTGGRQAVYWWPDVQAFLDRHHLPKPARTRKTTGGTDGQ